MFLLDNAVVTSPSDLKLLSECEFAFARTLDLKLGRLEAVPVDDDPMMKRAGALGDVHENARLVEYRAHHPGQVAEIARPESMTRDGLWVRAAQTVEALRGGAEVVFQATFFDETDPAAPTLGYADFLVRQPEGRYRVQDTKLARSVKVTALMQLAGYHEHLARLGIPVDDTVELILGDGTVSSHHIDDLAPLYGERRARLRSVVAERLADADAVAWGDNRYRVDGSCVHCAAEVQTHRDLLQVAGMRMTQRAKLLAVGIPNIDALAETTDRPADCTIPASTYRTLQQQAALQVQATAGAPPPYLLHNPAAIGELPAPSPGDLYFDFEGDPLYSEEYRGRTQWNLDYLFGFIDDHEQFTPIWAHDLASERAALERFLDLVAVRRAAHPGMHIYHYASYERTHLLSIAARHGVREREVDQLLRDGVLVDLYPLVKKALRVGSKSYSIKKLEPIYMGEQLRDDDGVTSAVGSVEAYWDYREKADTDAGAAAAILANIADYNEYDCVSTRRLRNWLLERAAERGVYPGVATAEEVGQDPFEPDPLAQQLLHLAGAAETDADRHAFELASAAIDYYRRENKSFWWEHFARLEYPVEQWADTRGVFLVSDAEVVDDWGKSGRQTKPRRVLRLHGEWAPGSSAPKEGDKPFLLYDQPVPYVRADRRVGARLDTEAEFGEQVDGVASVLVTEYCPADEETWTQLPTAIAPSTPPPSGSIVVAIREWAEALARGSWQADATSTILRRRPPTTRSGALEPMTSPDDAVRAIVASLLDLDAGALAVQGPPGTGKTYVASHVIAELVTRHRWRVGVVAQSHKVVEHVLTSIVESAGLDARLVGKARPSGSVSDLYLDAAFREIGSDSHGTFAAERSDTGYVIGGTAWDFTNVKRITRQQLDLLVIEEAGQFSLAATIGAAQAARRVLLLGDPQQLPQVSQGIHPAPVDGSALGHLSDGHDVLPAELGYFLAESRRMDAAVTAPVSRLAYDGALRSHPSTEGRLLAGIEPGLHPVPIEHEGDSTSSGTEAAEVSHLVADLLGAEWTDAAAGRHGDPLTQRDIIVVTPYNAQVELISQRLAAAGFDQVRVGTVDKFQGQEAVVSIVSLAASSADDVPRGLSFLLSRNRLNVAISRAQWAAYLVYSPALTAHLPRRPDEVAELSRFIRLVRDSKEATR